MIKKRQEIGRGMRLPVDQSGGRVTDQQHRLTIIANESYAEYVSKLQQEYVDEYGDLMVAPKPDDGRRRKTFHLADRHELCPAFKALWDRVSTRTLYSVRVDTDDLIKKCVEEINCGMSEKKIGIRVDKVDLDIENGRGVVTKFTNSKLEPINNVFPVPNMVERIAEETNLTRRTVVRILSGIDKLSS